MSDIFDPRRYEGVRRPLLDAESLPPWCYTSDAFYRREVDEILVRSWNLVGRVDEIPSPGDYRVFDLCGRPAPTVARPDFGEHVGKYFKRWDRSIPEDNAISERQRAGLESAAAAAGRLSVHEPVAHSFANRVLDRTIGHVRVRSDPTAP